MPKDAEPIKMRVPPEELNKILDEYSNRLDTPAKARKAEKRVTFVRMRYNGFSIEECSKSLGITQRTCYNFQNEWNKKGKESIVPKTSTGANPKLSQEKVQEIRLIIRDNSFTVKETAEYIRNNTDTKLSENQIRRIFGDDVRRMRNRI